VSGVALEANEISSTYFSLTLRRFGKPVIAGEESIELKEFLVCFVSDV